MEGETDSGLQEGQTRSEMVGARTAACGVGATDSGLQGSRHGLREWAADGDLYGEWWGKGNGQGQGKWAA